MKTLTIKLNKINLPSEIARKFDGKEIEILETKEGVLLRRVENAIKKTQGFLKGKGSFSSKKFMAKKGRREVTRIEDEKLYARHCGP